MLEIQNMTVCYQGQPAVKNFSMRLQAGEIVSLTGESGSGKTTVIRAVLGLLAGGGRVTQGDILLDGKSLLTNTPEEWRRLRGTEISMVFQDSGAMLNPRKDSPASSSIIPPISAAAVTSSIGSTSGSRYRVSRYGVLEPVTTAAAT